MMQSRKSLGKQAFIVLLPLILFTITLCCLILSPLVARAIPPVSERLGVAHCWGGYRFTTTDFMTEGANEIANTGSHVIKVWLSPNSRYAYGPNSTWPAYTNMVDTVKVSYFVNLFQRSEFHTYILTASPADDANAPPECPDWPNYTSASYQSVHDAFKNLTVYLMQTYKGTGKTFILQNWESDNAAQRFNLPLSVPANANKLIGWLNARQDGITDARNSLSSLTGVHVYGAAEVNYIGARNAADAWAIDRVVPWTHMDLYSYSCYSYDTAYSTSTLTANLNYIRSMAPDSAAFGNNNIYIGEFGAPTNVSDVGNEWTQYNLTYSQAKTALDWGALYVVYWQIFDNEWNASINDYNGYWLRKPDRTYPMVWSFFRDCCVNNAYPTAPQFNPTLYYNIVAKTSGKALDNSGSTANSAVMTQYTKMAGNTNQQWKIVYTGSGYYNVINRATGKALDNNGSNSNGTAITQYTLMAGNTNQKWRLVNLGNGYFSAVSQTSGKAMDNGGSTTNSTVITQSSWSITNSNQSWLISIAQ